jgi:type III pantothenate kinase
MLLAIDVGNTNTVLGLYKLDNAPGAEFIAHWRITTHRIQTADECGMQILNLFAMQDFKAADIKIKPLFVEPGIKTGMPLLIDNPAELGADRVANGVAAFARYGGPCIVVDFGTATTFDVITERGEYAGGVISPGLGISADALFSRAARLARVDIRKPDKVIGTNTRVNLQSGIYYGYIGLVDGILERIIAELAATRPGAIPKIIATGGLAKLIVADSKYITEIDHMLTLDGLRLIHERNQGRKPARNRNLKSE